MKNLSKFVTNLSKICQKFFIQMKNFRFTNEKFWQIFRKILISKWNLSKIFHKFLENFSLCCSWNDKFWAKFGKNTHKNEKYKFLKNWGKSFEKFFKNFPQTFGKFFKNCSFVRLKNFWKIFQKFLTYEKFFKIFSFVNCMKNFWQICCKFVKNFWQIFHKFFINFWWKIYEKFMENLSKFFKNFSKICHKFVKSEKFSENLSKIFHLWMKNLSKFFHYSFDKYRIFHKFDKFSSFQFLLENSEYQNFLELNKSFVKILWTSAIRTGCERDKDLVLIGFRFFHKLGKWTTKLFTTFWWTISLAMTKVKYISQTEVVFSLKFWK